MILRLLACLFAVMFASHSYAVGYSYNPELHETFRALDLNKDGTLQRPETPPLINFDQFDVDRNQGISFAEFCKVQKHLIVPYKASKHPPTRKRTMQALKTTLSTLHRDLERQGFMPLGRRLQNLNPNLSLKPLAEFLAWVNTTPEVREALETQGIHWTPPANATTLGQGCPVRIKDADDVSDFGEPPLVNCKGTVTAVDTIDNGATADDPLFVVLLEDGRQEAFWTEQLEVLSA